MRAALTALALLCAGTCAGCGGARPSTAPTTTVATKRAPAPTLGLRVGVLGPLEVKPVAGAAIAVGHALPTMPAYPLVIVSAQAADLTAVRSVAARYPTSHYAYLAGVVAGLVVSDQGGPDARIAWVGPQEQALATAFARGAQEVRPGTTVLRAWSSALPAACKEAALGAIGRGAVVVMAHGGLCARAAIAGAHQQNRVGLQISDFELPTVPIGSLIADAVAGVYRGGEDIVFGASTGAIGIRHLDPRISADIDARARAAAQQLASGLRPAG